MDGFLLADEFDYKVVHVGLSDTIGPPEFGLIDLDNKISFRTSNMSPIQLLALMLNHETNILQLTTVNDIELD